MCFLLLRDVKADKKVSFLLLDLHNKDHCQRSLIIERSLYTPPCIGFGYSSLITCSGSLIYFGLQSVLYLITEAEVLLMLKQQYFMLKFSKSSESQASAGPRVTCIMLNIRQIHVLQMVSENTLTLHKILAVMVSKLHQNYMVSTYLYALSLSVCSLSVFLCLFTILQKQIHTQEDDHQHFSS